MSMRFIPLVACLSVAFMAATASAQVAGQVAGGVVGNVAGNVQGGAQGNVNGAAAGGIMIDAQGVVKTVFASDPNEKLAKQRMEAYAGKTFSADLNRPSELRKVSLVRLEKACEEYAEKKENVPLEMDFLAGLQRIDYVFVFPEEKDIVIAGPAEGFAPDAIGRMVGLKTGRPPLRLDDLMVSLRSQERGNGVGCSIDPVPERLAAFERYARANNTATSREQIAARYQEMARILGMQDVRVWGVPNESHFAATLVEADYRMKMLSVGLEGVNVKGFKSHLAIVPARGKSMQRWWIAPLYDPFKMSADGNAFQFSGQRAQLMAQEEVVDAKGGTSDAATTRVSTQKWAQLFTDKLPEIAAKSAIFAELQNLIDLQVLAALLKKERLPEKADWKMSLFLDAEKATVAAGRAPRQVPSVANYKVTNQQMVTGLVGGGVVIGASQALRQSRFVTDDTDSLKNRRAESLSREPPAQHPWWWD